jgi:hypothetical protein
MRALFALLLAGFFTACGMPAPGDVEFPQPSPPLRVTAPARTPPPDWPSRKDPLPQPQGLDSVPAQRRVGVGVVRPIEDAAWLEVLGAGFYLHWRTLESPPPGPEYWQMVRASKGKFFTPVDEIRRAAAANPGATWVVGNEPDVHAQDSMTPATFAAAYHHFYTIIRDADPSARIAVGAVGAATPLRLAYLDAALAAYRAQFGSELPADMWTFHIYILPEVAGRWGLKIPPGMEARRGWTFGTDAHLDLWRFEAQVRAFRAWMAGRGYRDMPLALTEFGVLMPAVYGYDAEAAAHFLESTFDFLRTATDSETGLPSDGNRLVQYWAWFSLADPLYPESDLVDPITGDLTAVGRRFRAYIQGW